MISTKIDASIDADFVLEVLSSVSGPFPAAASDDVARAWLEARKFDPANPRAVRKSRRDMVSHQVTVLASGSLT